jgi:hypothetical protein
LESDLRLKEKHIPAARLLIKRASVVHLPRIDNNNVPANGFYPTDAAPRAMAARVDDAYAKLIVGVTRKLAGRVQAYRFDPK